MGTTLWSLSLVRPLCACDIYMTNGLIIIGTQIAVYGTYDYSSSGVITSYAVDGGNATRVTHSSGSGDTYNEMFWESDPLELQQQ